MIKDPLYALDKDIFHVICNLKCRGVQAKPAGEAGDQACGAWRNKAQHHGLKSVCTGEASREAQAAQKSLEERR
jgi:hypothetical protein